MHVPAKSEGCPTAQGESSQETLVCRHRPELDEKDLATSVM